MHWRHFSSLLFLLPIAPLARAQNNFAIWPELNGSSATYTDRWVGGNPGEVLMEVPGSLFAGVGDQGSACEALGFWHWGTDENVTTQESYHVVLRLQNPAGPGPDMSPAGLLLRLGPLLVPTGASGRMAWLLTTTFASPLRIPCTGGFYLGMELIAAPGWTTDGHSVWVAWYSPPASRGVGDNPRAGAPNHAWAVISGVPRPAGSPATARMGLLVAGPVLNLGNLDPNSTRQTPAGSSCYGAGGLYPDILSRSDGLDARVLDGAGSGGLAVLFLGTGISPIGGLPFTGISGRFYLDFTGPVVFLGSAPIAGGIATVPVALPGTVPLSLVGGFVFFQALTLDATFTSFWFTNLQGAGY